MKIFLTLILFALLVSCSVKEDGKKLQWQYYYDLGMSSYISKNYSEAIANFFRASQLAPMEPKVWNALGLAYMEVQEYAKAENALNKALQVDRSFTEAKLNLGVLYYRQRAYEKALNTLKEVLQDEAFPQKHMAYYHLAKVYQAMDNKEEYIKNLNKAVAYNPLFVDAQLELAQVYEGDRNYIKAREIYQNLINNGISSPSLDLSMARVEYNLGNYAVAKEYIRRVIDSRQASNAMKSQAYELLSMVLVKEQEKLLSLKQEAQRQVQPSEEVKKQTEKKEQENLESQPAVEQKTQPGYYYRIQLGAFSSEGIAKRWKEKLERELNLKELFIVESSGIYRVLYGRFESKDKAKQELDRIKAYNIYGFIVQE